MHDRQNTEEILYPKRCLWICGLRCTAILLNYIRFVLYPNSRYHKQAYLKLLNINKTKSLEVIRIEEKRNLGLRSSSVVLRHFTRQFAFKIDPASE